MANVERFDAFPTCIYRFKYDFEGTQNKIDLSKNFLTNINLLIKQLVSIKN